MSPSHDFDAEFDFIIVGAGSAGCLLANRLSANPDHRVLPVEAGGKDNWFWIKVPVGYPAEGALEDLGRLAGRRCPSGHCPDRRVQPGRQ